MNMMRVWDVEDAEERRIIASFYLKEDAEDYADYLATIGRTGKVYPSQVPSLVEVEPRASA